MFWARETDEGLLRNKGSLERRKWKSVRRIGHGEKDYSQSKE